MNHPPLEGLFLHTFSNLLSMTWVFYGMEKRSNYKSPILHLSQLKLQEATKSQSYKINSGEVR